MPLHLRVATLEKIVFDEEVSYISLPGEAGEIGVLPGHAPLITSLKLGEIVAHNGGKNFYMTVSSGMAEIQPHRVIVLADRSERAEEIDEQLAEEAKAKAEQIMTEKHIDAESFAAAEAQLKKSLLRIKVARRHKSVKGLSEFSES